jgi:hypothetical protein
MCGGEASFRERAKREKNHRQIDRNAIYTPRPRPWRQRSGDPTGPFIYNAKINCQATLLHIGTGGGGEREHT